jgi:hypothetical protein
MLINYFFLKGSGLYVVLSSSGKLSLVIEISTGLVSSSQTLCVEHDNGTSPIVISSEMTGRQFTECVNGRHR